MITLSMRRNWVIKAFTSPKASYLTSKPCNREIKFLQTLRSQSSNLTSLFWSLKFSVPPHFNLKSLTAQFIVWTLRKKSSTKKDSWWLTGLKKQTKNQPSRHFYRETSVTHKLHLREKPALKHLPLHWTACLHCVPVIWASPYKWVPGILFQPIGLRLSPSNRNCAIPTNYSTSILTNQGSVFWFHQISRIWSLHLHEERPGPRRGKFFLCKPTPLWLWEPTFPFNQRLKTVFPWLTWDVSLEQSAANQWSTKQTSIGQNCLAGKAPGSESPWLPSGCLTALLFSQLCCITIELLCRE